MDTQLAETVGHTHKFIILAIVTILVGVAYFFVYVPPKSQFPDHKLGFNTAKDSKAVADLQKRVEELAKGGGSPAKGKKKVKRD